MVTEHDVTPYPLMLEPILMPKVWGGHRLAAFDKELPAGIAIGESWEVADLRATSPSGGGGGEARSRIVNGAWADRTLHDALASWGASLVGDAWSEATEFPLLVKFLDAEQHLSVQTHPTPEYAATHPDAHVKAESWYIIDAAPGAEVFIGLLPGTTLSDVRAAVTEARIRDVLRAVSAVPGTCHHLPSGTVHALGAGVVVAEFQSPSDTTFRLYDWTEEYGRASRELHLQAALDSLLLTPPPPPTRMPDAVGLSDLAATSRYMLRGARGLHGVPLTAGTCSVVMAVDGTATLESAAGTMPLPKGTTAVVPAAIAAGTKLDIGEATVLIADLNAPPTDRGLSPTE